jgi:sugar phosphate isomerase/epimerase
VPDVIDSLRQAGYNGWLVVEQDTTPDDPTQIAANNRRYLEPLIT